ncbi:class I SAM-dependent methyltransferase [Desulfofustis glycolicus]|uniref:Lysine methyltransferase n=1 Tax=Desulfofustis glycolicus DSM 9705 TaxID=1121409 RepID=A0A1M5UHT1_9BACT|nr:methyltransferase [Desulfofustis glycolicus]MCB2217478.1 methyltransferase domain-containing protein [Desulfobulbaceae bacterium]SHH62574.1 Lysine methyltransferase [Desulfofustis glycolicus DSM 9705]
MDIRTLPESERMLFNQLQQRHRLHFSRERFGGHTLRLLMPSDLEELLEGRDPFADVSRFPFWSRLWEAARVLAEVLVATADRPAGRLLELGAGLGAPGLAAAAAGYQVVLSDYEQFIIDFQRVSAAANGLTDVRCVLLDWLDPPKMERFNVIAGAEILFREEFVEPLLRICENYLQPDGIVYLAHDVRRQCLPVFLRAAQQRFVIGSRKQTLTRDGQTFDILVNRLQRRRDHQ